MSNQDRNTFIISLSDLVILPDGWKFTYTKKGERFPGVKITDPYYGQYYNGPIVLKDAPIRPKTPPISQR